MGGKTYALEGRTYRFSSEALDTLIRGRREGPYRTTRELARAIHVSPSSVKEWRCGTHAPSDLSKVEDCAMFFRTKTETLLKEEMIAMTKLDDLQLKSFCRVHGKILEFFWMAEYSDRFVWSEYDLRGFPPSLVGDVVPTRLWSQGSGRELAHGAHGIKAADLHQRLWEGVCRALEVEKPVLFSCGLYGDLSDYVERYVYGYAIDAESYEWVPDPDALFEPQDDACVSPSLSHMESVEVEASKAMAEIAERYGMLVGSL